MRVSSLRCSTVVMVAAMVCAVGAGCCSRRLNSSRTWGTVIAGVFFPHTPSLQHQEPDRQQRQRDVMMPTHPTAGFVMIQPDFAVAELKQFFDPMPVIVGLDQLFDGDMRPGVAQTVVCLRRRLDRAQDQQAFAGLLRVGLGTEVPSARMVRLLKKSLASKKSFRPP